MTAEERLAALEERLRRVEDELAISRAVDADVAAMVQSPAHRGLIGGGYRVWRAGANHLALRPTAAGWQNLAAGATGRPA